MPGIFESIGYKAVESTYRDNSTNYTSRLLAEEFAQQNNRFNYVMPQKDSYVGRVFDKNPVEKEPQLRVLPGKDYNVIDITSRLYSSPGKKIA